MKKIGEVIEIFSNENDFKKQSNRTTVRAIIIEDKKVLLTYSNVFDDYMTPGGGVLENEDLVDALKREVKEELGVKFKRLLEIGFIESIFKFKDKEVKWNNYFYLVSEISFGVHNREKYEVEYGMESKWITPSEAIIQNNKVIEERLKNGSILPAPFVSLKRDNLILKFIEEKYI